MRSWPRCRLLQDPIDRIARTLSESASNDLPVTEVAMPAAGTAAPSAHAARAGRWRIAALLVLLAIAVAALGVAWRGQQRVRALEQELVKRQQDSAGEATEARLLSKQAHELAQEAAAKSALLEARVQEVALQRTQLEELLSALSRSRDENLVADIDAGIRVALQQTAITGSAAPLVAALQQADERLARVAQPRLEPVRRAIARDLDRIRSVGVADLASLAIKLDEAARLVDEAPLLAFEPPKPEARPARPAPARPAPRGAASAPAAAAPASAPMPLPEWLPVSVATWWRSMWFETRDLLRVSRVDQPQAMLLAPEQSFFLRENLKLKLLNARLALLSRQFDIAQNDLQAALAATEAWFDRSGRKTVLLTELLRAVASQARQAGVPRPDDTLTALATAAAGR